MALSLSHSQTHMQTILSLSLRRPHTQARTHTHQLLLLPLLLLLLLPIFLLIRCYDCLQKVLQFMKRSQPEWRWRDPATPTQRNNQQRPPFILLKEWKSVIKSKKIQEQHFKTQSWKKGVTDKLWFRFYFCSELDKSSMRCLSNNSSSIFSAVWDSKRKKENFFECEEEEDGKKIQTIHFLEPQRKRRRNSSSVWAQNKIVCHGLEKKWNCDNTCLVCGKPTLFKVQLNISSK